MVTDIEAYTSVCVGAGCVAESPRSVPCEPMPMPMPIGAVPNQDDDSWLTRIQAHEVLEVGVSGPALRMDIYKLGRRRYALSCDVCLIT